MRSALIVWLVCIAGASSRNPTATNPQTGGAIDQYLTWSAEQAEAVGRGMYQRGRVGGFFDTRLLKTETSYNYKLAATWLTPEVIRASARMAQLRSRLTVSQTQELVSEADAVAGTVIMVELDPREGSGVIPRDWEAFLRPRGQDDRAVPGVDTPRLRDVRGLAGVLQRNYDYDRFWVVFPLQTPAGDPVFPENATEAELVVRVYSKEGRVTWRTPESVRQRARTAPANLPR